MKKVKRVIRLISKGKRLVYAFAAVVLAGSMFLGTGVTAHAVKLADVFDTQAYADKYPDLFAAFGNNAAALLKHYKEHGIAERREVEGIVDVVRYREAYPDLDAAFGDNWDAYVNHYFEFGAKEGRDNFTDFDGLAYAERYPDLKEAYGDDLLALYKHYQAFGKDEGRYAYEEPEEEEDEEDEEDKEDEDETYTVLTYMKHPRYGTVKVITEKTIKDDKMVRQTQYTSSGEMIADAVYYYHSNGKTKQTVGITYVDGKVSERTVIDFGSDGLMTKITNYDANNKKTGWVEYKYYSDGTRTETYYDADGNITDTFLRQ